MPGQVWARPIYVALGLIHGLLPPVPLVAFYILFRLIMGCILKCIFRWSYSRCQKGGTGSNFESAESKSLVHGSALGPIQGNYAICVGDAQLRTKLKEIWQRNILIKELLYYYGCDLSKFNLNFVQQKRVCETVTWWIKKGVQNWNYL